MRWAAAAAVAAAGRVSMPNGSSSGAAAARAGGTRARLVVARPERVGHLARVLPRAGGTTLGGGRALLALVCLLAGDLGASVPAASTAAVDMTAGLSALVGRPLEEIEKVFIAETLKLTGGNREQAADLLGIGERTLYRKIKEYQLS
jgi:DNA-binding NtrC family response regulator